MDLSFFVQRVGIITPVFPPFINYHINPRGNEAHVYTCMPLNMDLNMDLEIDIEWILHAFTLDKAVGIFTFKAIRVQ